MFYNYERTAAGTTAAFYQWYWVVPPGIAITLLSMAFIMIGFSLEERTAAVREYNFSVSRRS